MFLYIMSTTANKPWGVLALLVSGIDCLLSLLGMVSFFL
ncbi:hypothetical protein FHU10_2208 [Serratia fonticola]|uniref:Uncharacterized protein n=1 Tax=Serratia fonticola TaxID=47917 RepID=A0A542CWI5_SERFO|nr:hypothetical protein FHU09_0244 [Serratia fonticola]TQI95180.1 hypothetical protein FHU11_0548 [Serratia fonticola]TVZ69678.1 hypothetical protein FHU10_2208 [Serratia fonticola]